MEDTFSPHQKDRRRPVWLNWSHWYLSLLKLAVGLLLILLVALLWLLRENEIDEQRSTLIADVLWLEQSVRFFLEGNSEQLRQLSLDLTRTKDRGSVFAVRARHILKTNPELQQVLWLDQLGKPLHGMPTQSLPRRGPEASGEGQVGRAIDLAQLGKPAYSDAYGPAGAAQFDVYVPIFDDGRYSGTLLGVYSLDRLLKQHVPWWFAKKYQVRVLDGNGKVLASKSKIDAASTTLTYPVILDPPGYGMVLQVTAYRGADNLAQTLIAGLIIILAAAVLWSLWAVRGLIQKRLFAEQALRAEYAFRKAMEDSLMVGMRARDLDGRVSYVNPAFLQMVGFSADELIGREPPMPYWAPEEMERTLQLHNDVLEGKAPKEGFEIRLMRKDGSRFDALVYEAPLIDADGQQTGWMASIIDVTARKHAEELAQQQQEKLQVTARLVTMGEMASTLAHELNQPLAAITSYNTGCLNKLESGKFTALQLREALEKLAVQAQRAGHIIRRVHDFVRKSEPKRVPCDLAEVIDDSVGFIDAAAKARGVRIVREIQGMRPELLADPVMLEQVLLNLMRNGIEAMRHTPSELRQLTVKLSQLDRQQMQIRVIDRGPGIPPEVEEKLFTPLFSTKAEGMGMGLNICRSIIEVHHGRLWVE
ncbi:MAG: PAS domain S-box protein, partial [Candidatus Accumulibacter sp.]|nr:PAS domain S-box protein [Accumulibacter sp.]